MQISWSQVLFRNMVLQLDLKKIFQPFGFLQSRSRQPPESPKAQLFLVQERPISKLSPSLGGMLRVFMASGEEVFAIGFEEFVAVAPEREWPATARALKCHVQRVSGQSRFQQRLLLLDGHMLLDDFVFRGPTDLQLILQQFEASSAEQIRHLRDAAHGNDLQAMEQLLQRPQDPDLEAGGLPPALHVACGQGHTQAARLLLEANADKDRVFGNQGSTPMHWACTGGHAQVVRLLLEANADKDNATNNGVTPLIMASQKGHLEVTQLLLEANADKEKATENGATPLFTASQKGHLEVTRLLLEANANKDKAMNDGATPLFMASQKGHLEVARLLLEENADKDKAMNDGATPLVVASYEGHLAVAQLLLEENANQDKAMNNGATPLIVASQEGHLAVAQLLLEANADKDKGNNNGATPLIVASKMGHLQVARLLLEANADKDKAENNGGTPLFVATQKRHLAVVRLLLEANSDKEKAVEITQLRSSWHHRMLVTWKLLGCCWRRSLARINKKQWCNCIVHVQLYKLSGKELELQRALQRRVLFSLV